MDEEAKDISKQIEKNTAHKTSFQVIVSGNKSNFNTLFNPKIELDREKVYEIALVNLETYYSLFIIHFQILTIQIIFLYTLTTRTNLDKNKNPYWQL